MTERTLPNQDPRHVRPNAGSPTNLNLQVMVVDDDPSMCDFLRSFLSARGYQAITFVNADDAVKRYREERPAAVILDIVMSDAMDGLEALAAFKKIDRDVPVIVLSGEGRTTTIVQAIKLGASDFVSKPFDEADLERAVAGGQFREDLFFRLNVVSIHIPPLRDRREQIPALVDYLLKKCCVHYNKPFSEMSPDTMLFMEYDWPGNVRELENLIRRVVVLGSETHVREELVHIIAIHRPAAPAPPHAARWPPVRRATPRLLRSRTSPAPPRAWSSAS